MGASKTLGGPPDLVGEKEWSNAAGWASYGDDEEDREREEAWSNAAGWASYGDDEEEGQREEVLSLDLEFRRRVQGFLAGPDTVEGCSWESLCQPGNDYDHPGNGHA